MAKRYSSNFERDYQFYLLNLDRFDFSGNPYIQVKYDKNGKDAKHCFWKYDSTGKVLPCVDPELFQKLVTCKGSVNLHIEMWAEGRANGISMRFEFEEYLKEINAPEWILTAMDRQTYKLISKKYLENPSKDITFNVRYEV